MTERMKIQSQHKTRTLGEMETFKYYGILEMDIIKQVDMKVKIS